MSWWWWIPSVCLLIYLLCIFSPKFNYFAKFTYLYLAYIFLRYLKYPNVNQLSSSQPSYPDHIASTTAKPIKWRVGGQNSTDCKLSGEIDTEHL